MLVTGSDLKYPESVVWQPAKAYGASAGVRDEIEYRYRPGLPQGKIDPSSDNSAEATTRTDKVPGSQNTFSSTRK